MSSIDFSITNIAFPALTQFFHRELATVMWVTLAFTLVSSSLMLLLGKTGDLFGRKKIYSIGIAIFTLGLLACALSQSIGQLILFRAFQALGAAMIISCGAAIVTAAFPPNELGKGLGFMGVAVSVGFIIGPVLGGFLLDWLGWRSIFFLRAPLGVITVFMAIWFLKRDEIVGGDNPIDIMGALTSSFGLFFIIFGLSQLKRLGSGSYVVWLLIGIGILILVSFVFIERRAKDPVVDVTLFKDMVFTGAILSLFLFFVAAPSFFILMPFYLIQGIGLAPSSAGLLLSVNSMATIVSGPLGGWFSDRFGAVWPSSLGAGLSAVVFFILLGFDLQTPVNTIILVLILLGLGVGMFNPANNSVIMSAVSRDRLGSTSALVATQRHVGVSIGMTVIGVLFSAKNSAYQAEIMQTGVESAQAARQSISAAFHDVLIIPIILSVVVVLLCVFMKTGKKSILNNP
ncbi:MAG: MFS transporter [Deltaproteobacteria bacterium]|nr:MFS transporter [Deltaproteobacteria bacterium]